MRLIELVSDSDTWRNLVGIERDEEDPLAGVPKQVQGDSVRNKRHNQFCVYSDIFDCRGINAISALLI